MWEHFDWVLPVAGCIVLLGGAITVLVKGGKWLFSTIHKINEFLADWRGEAARPGHDATMGIPERLSNIEQRLKRVEHEVKPNGGSSMHDKIDKIADQVS